MTKCKIDCGCESWIVEAENKAKDLAKILLKQITNEADYLCVDRKWFFEKVLQHMRAGSEEKKE